MRPFRFAIHLKEFGWQPTVLTIAASGQTLTSKEERLLENVDIIELRPPFDRTTSSAQSQLDPTAGEAKRATARASFLDRLLDSFDRQFPIDTWLPFFLLKYRTLVQTVRHVQPDVLWSTGDPWSGLVVAWHLGQRFDVPWVADFRDPWTLSEARMDGTSRPTRAVNRFFERRILRDADAAVFAAEATEQKYRRHYARFHPRTTTIYNSYDSKVFDDPVAGEIADVSSPASSSGLEIGFFGRFRVTSPATLIADALAAARQRHGILAEDVRVHSFGPLSAADARYADRHGVRGHFHRREAVPLEQALSALRRFDLLLVSAGVRHDEVVPSKLMEYLATGRPILSLSKNPEVGRILERTGTGVQLSPEAPGQVADLLVESLEAKRAGQPLPVPFDPQPDEIRHFAAGPTTKALAALFEEVTR